MEILTFIIIISCIIICGAVFARFFPIIIEVKLTSLTKLVGALIGMMVGTMIGFLLVRKEMGPIIGTLIVFVPLLLVFIILRFPTTIGRFLGVEVKKEDNIE